MITILNLELKQSYKYVWLKYVNGIDLNNHCAKCLLGRYDNRINSKVRTVKNLSLPKSPYYYFCTVNGYEDNIHLAFVEEKGSMIVINNDFFKCEIMNAKRINIDSSHINFELPQSKKSEFYSCRNWQFANYLSELNDGLIKGVLKKRGC